MIEKLPENDQFNIHYFNFLKFNQIPNRNINSIFDFIAIVDKI